MANDPLPGFDQFFGKQGGGAAPAPPQPTSGALPGFDQHFAPRAPAAPAAAPPPAYNPLAGGSANTGLPPGATGAPPAPSNAWTLNPQTWNVPLPQSVQDAGTLYGNEWAMGTLPGLRTQADAARQRLGPVASAAAEATGSATSPSQLLNLTSLIAPGSGPPLAGGVHEGLKSYMNQPDWVPTYKNWEKIVGDTSAGVIEGGIAGTTAKAAPALAPVMARTAQFGIPTALGVAGHNLFGQGDIVREAMHIVPEIGSAFGLSEPWKALGEYGKSALNTPAAQQAIKSLIMGGGSALRNYAGPYDQWIPGQ